MKTSLLVISVLFLAVNVDLTVSGRVKRISKRWQFFDVCEFEFLIVGLFQS